ncbi:MAG: oligosaccharide flippase family protein [Acidobacteriia bacterium]|nr:oligosaccharide flippase family protein [Terriglobia bacterium]
MRTGSGTLSNPFKNILRLATGDLVAKATSFLAFVYLARVLGVSNFGVLEFAGSVLTYLLLIGDGGLEMWGTREAATTADVPALAARVVPLRLLLASISFLILVLLLPLFPHYPNLRAVLLVYGLTVFAQAFSLKWTFMGQQNMTRVARGLVIGQVVFAVAVVAFIHSAVGLVWVPVFRLVGDLATTIYFARWFRRIHGRLPLRMTLRGMRVILKPAFTIGFSLALGLLNYNFDAVLLGFLRGAAFVAWYNAAYKLLLVGVGVAITYFTGLFPALSRLYVENREGFRLLVRRTAEIWLLFVVPLVVGGTFLADPVIRLLYGTAYASSVGPFRILLWSAALVILRFVYMDSLRATGHQALDLRCAITSASLNVTLNILLIPRFGMIGAATATTFADAIWFVMSYHYFRRAVLPGESFPSLRGPLLGGAAMGSVLWFARSVNWPLQVVVSLIVYLIVQALFGSVRLGPWAEETVQK